MGYLRDYTTPPIGTKVRDGKYGKHDYQFSDLQTCGERIDQLRRQMMLHSHIYYELNENTISDYEFDKRAYELVDLQSKNPLVSNAVPYERKAFEDWDGSTGFNLPYKTPYLSAKAQQHLAHHRTVKERQKSVTEVEEEKEGEWVSGVKLYPHQERAVAEMSNGKVLVGGVGTGKTITSLAYFYTKVMGGWTLGDPTSITNPMDLYVFTTARKRDELDWQKDAAQLMIGRDRDASIFGIKMVVESYNNIHKYQDVKDAFIILDEQRMVGSGAWVKSFLKLAKNNKWIMLSATPGDKWEDYIPLFIANGFVKNRTEFKRNHIVYSSFSKFPKVERYLEVGKLLKWRKSLLVDMPYLRHTTRHLNDVRVDHDVDLMKQVYEKRWNPYEKRPLRDVGEMFAMMRKVAYSDPSRKEKVIELLTEKHPKLIVFYNFDYELEMLRTISEDLPEWSVAEWNGHKHEAVPTTDKWLYLVQYMAGAEAWNCTQTDAICFYSQTYSYRNFEQAQGRIDRLDTPFKDLQYYLLKSSSLIDAAISRSLRTKKSFNESDFGVKWT